MCFISRVGLYLSLVVAFLLSGCGIVLYPGQPGMASSSFAKLDLEILEEPGLFVYESVYDNTSNGRGVSTVITKLYPKAQTYTTNVRTNADGTLFRVRSQYNGAEIQMISIPQQNQIYLNPSHQLAFLIDYESSLDEVDEKNVAEENLFKPSPLDSLRPQSFETKRMRWEFIKAARFLTSGNLGYEVTAVQLGEVKYTPSQPILLETSLAQNAIRTNLSKESKQEFTQFFEGNFPRGYKGKVLFQVKGTVQPVALNLGVNTFKTAEAGGLKIIKGIPDALLKEVQNPSPIEKK